MALTGLSRPRLRDSPPYCQVATPSRSPQTSHDMSSRAGGQAGQGAGRAPGYGAELEVALGQAALGVAGQGQGDLVPANVDVGVGMVAGRLGRCGDLVDEHHCVGEVGACEGLDDLVARRSQPAVHPRGNPC
jgi:hypothetical protein